MNNSQVPLGYAPPPSLFLVFGYRDITISYFYPFSKPNQYAPNYGMLMYSSLWG